MSKMTMPELLELAHETIRRWILLIVPFRQMMPRSKLNAGELVNWRTTVETR